MKKILLIDPVGRSRGMERWHENFSNLVISRFDLTILGNYHSALVKKSFTYDKEKKLSSVWSILKFALRPTFKSVDKIAIAHYGESMNTLLFLPAVLRYRKNKRYLLIHDVESTLKSERKGLRNRLTKMADKILFSFFDKLIVHNANVGSLFPGKEAFDMPLPPTIFPELMEHKSSTDKYIFWGFIKRSKNVEFIFDLARIMPYKTFDIYGTFINEEYKTAFLTILEGEKLANLNFFETYVDEKEIGNLLSKYDAVLMPYTFITNSGILQTNADYCAVSITSDLPAFRACSDISVNLGLNTAVWKTYLDALTVTQIDHEKKKILVSNAKRVSEFKERLEVLAGLD